MELFQKFLLRESQKAAGKQVDHAITIISKIYNEWKKVKRRINAVDIVSTSVNKIANIDPSVVDYIHAAAKAKLCIIIVRCLDNPVWKPLDAKEKIYKKLYPLIAKLQNEPVMTGTGGTLRDVIMTRLSASMAYQLSRGNVFVAYEPKLPTSYMRFLFGSDTPAKTYRMQSLPLSKDFETVLDTLKINHEKAMGRYTPALGVYAAKKKKTAPKKK
jgi:hypothetical protein